MGDWQDVDKQINKINVNKATGFDGASVKILKVAKPVIVKPITKLINMSIRNSEFPEDLKEAELWLVPTASQKEKK